MQPLSDRTAGFTDSVIRRMTRISNQYGAVNLSQGFPDFDPPKAILDRLAEVAHEDYHQYSITWGAQNFREALAAKQTRYMGRTIDPNSEIVVTCGSTEAMMAAMMTVTDPGDKVIVFSPFYENYGADAILSGAQPIYVPLYLPEFDFNPDELEAAFKQHPKALILCNPSNPCGKVFTYNELKFIADLAEKYNADNFVLISTDKAVEPISVMGASKRCCEMYVYEKSLKSKHTKFSAVRFGNVLNSNGSVIPLFKKQVENGVVTVTDKDVTRFFMTIPQAVELVLMSLTIANGGEIFVFDMGEAVRILDVAEKVIKDGGKVPYKDVKIEFTGLRKGDKLHEKLFCDFEQPQKTRYKKILRVNGSSIENFAKMLDKLYEKAYKNDSDGVHEIIMKMTNS